MTRCHRPTNESSTASHRPIVLTPSSYRPDTGFSACATICRYTYVQNFHRVSPAANGPLACSPISQRPAVCHHRVLPFAWNLPHGTLTRRSVTAKVEFTYCRLGVLCCTVRTDGGARRHCTVGRWGNGQHIPGPSEDGGTRQSFSIANIFAGSLSSVAPKRIQALFL